MNKHYIKIDGKDYIIVIKNNELNLFENNNGNVVKVNTNNYKTKEEMMQNALTGLMQIIEEEINENIKNKKYNSIEEITKDIKNKVCSINVPQFKTVINEVNFETNAEYKAMLKRLSEVFSKLDIEKKKQIVEEETNIDLKTLFTRNGIKEYEVSQNKSVITYEKDGKTYTFNNPDPNNTIYDVVLNDLNLEKMNSEEEIDKEIERIMELESQNKYQQNQTVDVNSLENYEKAITDFLKKEYSYINIKGIKPENSYIIDGGWIAETDNGEKIPIFVTKDANETLSVTFGKEKQISSSSSPETEMKQINADSEEIEKQIDSETKKQQLVTIYEKYIYNGESLTEEDKQVIESYNNEEEFNKLSEETQIICQEILDEYNKEKDNIQSKTNENGRQYKLIPPKNQPKPDEAGIAYIGIVTFLSGLITGLFVFTFFKLFL